MQLTMNSNAHPETWLDYSGGKLTGEAIRNAGHSGVIRYIDDPELLGRKHINLEEYRSMMANDVDVRLVFEHNTNDSDGGRSQGRKNALRALAGADYLGYQGIVYFCNDKPVLTSATVWDDYLTGAADILGWSSVGAYGFQNAMDVASHMTPCENFWQCGARNAVRPFVQMYQRNNDKTWINNVECDINDILIQTEELRMADLNSLLDFPITFTSTTDPTYSEIHTLRYVLSDVFFKTSDNWSWLQRLHELLADEGGEELAQRIANAVQEKLAS